VREKLVDKASGGGHFEDRILDVERASNQDLEPKDSINYTSRETRHHMMMTQQTLWYFLHLVGVIIWAGGFVYLVMAFIPAMNAATASEERNLVLKQAAAKFRRISWTAIVLLIVTGVMNFFERVSIAQEAQLPSGALLPSGYMGLLGVKLLIVIGLIVHHAIRLIEPRELEDGRVGLKSKATVIVVLLMFTLAVLMGLVLITM